MVDIKTQVAAILKDYGSEEGIPADHVYWNLKDRLVPEIEHPDPNVVAKPAETKEEKKEQKEMEKEFDFLLKQELEHKPAKKKR